VGALRYEALEALLGMRNRIGPGDANGVETMLARDFEQRLFQLM
jgi:hypothetical protein